MKITTIDYEQEALTIEIATNWNRSAGGPILVPAVASPRSASSPTTAFMARVSCESKHSRGGWRAKIGGKIGWTKP